MKKLSIVIATHLRKAKECRECQGFINALSFPALVVSILEDSQPVREDDARRVAGAAWKYFACGWAEQKWLAGAYAKSQRIEATLSAGMSRSIGVDMKFFGAGVKEPHFIFNVSFIVTGDVVSASSGS